MINKINFKLLSRIKKSCCFILTAAFLWSCAPTRIVKPLEKNQKAINISAGGPLIGLGNLVIPIPLTSFTYAQGITNNITVLGSLHTTALLYGVFQGEIGVTTKIYYNDSLKFGISASPVLNFAIDKWEWNKKIWPQLDFNFHWSYKRNLFYLGCSNWIELSSTKAHGEEQTTRWLYNPHLGYIFNSNKWSFNAETKLIAPNINRLPNAVDYKGFGSTGAIGIYVGVTRYF